MPLFHSIESLPVSVIEDCDLQVRDSIGAVSFLSDQVGNNQQIFHRPCQGCTAAGREAKLQLRRGVKVGKDTIDYNSLTGHCNTDCTHRTNA